MSVRIEVPLRVAVVGSGPSGFYAAGFLLACEDRAIEVDMLERLPTPWGLVRSGVAPDHPKIKSVTRVYEKIAAHPRFRWYGNLEVGRDVTRDDLVARYDAVVYAVGAEVGRPLGVPGAELPGVAPATDFVGWYNGHPDHRDHEFDLSVERAVVVGNGNVALDVARMLSLSHDELRTTDIADHALHALRDSRIRHVTLLGRRGPVQAAFTTPELRELGELARAAVHVDAADLPLDGGSRAALDDGASPTTRRNMDLLRQFAARGRDPAGPPRSPCASCARRSRSRATAAPRRSSRPSTSSSPARTGRSSRGRPAARTGCRPALCSDRSATAAGRSRAYRSTPHAAWSRTTRAASPGARGST